MSNQTTGQQGAGVCSQKSMLLQCQGWHAIATIVICGAKITPFEEIKEKGEDKKLKEKPRSDSRFFFSGYGAPAFAKASGGQAGGMTWTRRR